MTMTLPEIRDWEICDQYGNETKFRAHLLGIGSSEQNYHQEHVSEDFARRGARCSACRWFEVTIYLSDPNSDDAHYLVHTVGRSVVPGEKDRHTVTWTDAPDEIIEILTQRGDGSVDPWLPATSARALAQAARYDVDIREAYRERRVA